MKTVLVGIDLPDTNGRTLDTSITLARALGARLVVLHVVRPPLNICDEWPDRDYAAAYSEQAALHLTRLQRNLLQRRVTIETRHVVGQPGQRIVELASALVATYVVVGTHDRGPIASFFLGGTAIQVLREAPCPVIVVPPATRAQSRSPR